MANGISLFGRRSYIYIYIYVYLLIFISIGYMSSSRSKWGVPELTDTSEFAEFPDTHHLHIIIVIVISV